MLVNTSLDVGVVSRTQLPHAALPPRLNSQSHLAAIHYGSSDSHRPFAHPQVQSGRASHQPPNAIIGVGASQHFRRICMRVGQHTPHPSPCPVRSQCADPREKTAYAPLTSTRRERDVGGDQWRGPSLPPRGSPESLFSSFTCP